MKEVVLWLVLCLSCGDVTVADHIPKGHRMECVECGEIVDVAVKPFHDGG